MKTNLKILLSLCVVITLVCTFGIMVGCSSSSEDGPDEEMAMMEEEEEQEEEMMPDNTCPNGSLFAEKDGIVHIDLENPGPSSNGWSTNNSLSGFSGSGYLVWTDEDNFNTPGKGIIRFSIRINTPGTYQFVWSSRIAQGTSNTDFNDSWLRIPTANDFYGEKAGGERVFPKGSGKTPVPEGAGANGWFKVYMNTVGEWFWRSSTSDNDPHNIFARFDAAGTYDIEISGRSKFHAIDEMVLFKTDKTLTDAQNAPLSEITCKP